MMRTVNMHHAKTHLSRLVAEAANGEPFIIARAGKALVKVVALEPAEQPLPRIGFMKGADWVIPEDFDTFAQDEIIAMFEESDELEP